MKSILSGIGFILFIFGISGIDGWMCNGTSLIVPLVMLGVSVLILRKEIKNVSDI